MTLLGYVFSTPTSSLFSPTLTKLSCRSVSSTSLEIKTSRAFRISCKIRAKLRKIRTSCPSGEGRLRLSNLHYTRVSENNSDPATYTVRSNYGFRTLGVSGTGGSGRGAGGANGHLRGNETETLIGWSTARMRGGDHPEASERRR